MINFAIFDLVTDIRGSESLRTIPNMPLFKIGQSMLMLRLMLRLGFLRGLISSEKKGEYMFNDQFCKF
jgi:hypothetical protein